MPGVLRTASGESPWEADYARYFDSRVQDFQCENARLADAPGRTPARVDAVLLGDSITDDHFRDGAGGFHLAREAEGDLNGLVLNRGISGDRLRPFGGRAATERLDSLCPASAQAPAHLFVLLGVNDLLHGRVVGDALNDYAQLVQRLGERFPASQLHLFTLLHTSEPRHDSLNPAIEQFNAGLKAVGDHHRVDVRTALTEASTAHPEGLSDGLHPVPGSAIYRTYAEQVLEVLGG